MTSSHPTPTPCQWFSWLAADLLDLPEGETEFRFTVERREDGIFVSHAEAVSVRKPGEAGGDV